MRQMKDLAIVCNIGHFDSEIQVEALKKYKWTEVKPQVHEIRFRAAGESFSWQKAGW